MDRSLPGGSAPLSRQVAAVNDARGVLGLSASVLLSGAATVLFEIGRSVFLLYLAVADYDAVYGLPSAIIVLMIWLVVSAWEFLDRDEDNSIRQRFLARS